MHTPQRRFAGLAAATAAGLLLATAATGASAATGATGTTAGTASLSHPTAATTPSATTTATPTTATPTAATTAAPTGEREARSAGEDMTPGTSPAPMPVMPEAYELARLFGQMSGPALEQAYLAEMIGHHEMAVMMAQVELEKGQRPAVKALASRIISAQRQEIDQMTTWLDQWYGMTPDQAMAAAPADVQALVGQMETMMGEHMMTPLEQAAPGAQTDIVFLQHMIPHHTMAIIETGPALDGFTHRELIRAGRHIIVSQSAEVVLMRHWLRVWGDDVPMQPGMPMEPDVPMQPGMPSPATMRSGAVGTLS